MQKVAGSPPGVQIQTRSDLIDWIEENDGEREFDGSLVVTYVISVEFVLLIAPRRSEHIACSGGHPVLAAGELVVSDDGEICCASNQSTGFCPDPECWSAVARTLDGIPLEHPGDFTVKVTFRLCPGCNQRNIVKDNWYYCELCDHELPPHWNFQS